MSANDLVEIVQALYRENRALKSKQAIAGSAIDTASNTTYADRITVAAGQATQGVQGYVNFTSVNSDGTAVTSRPTLSMVVEGKYSDMSWSYPFAQSYPSGSMIFRAILNTLNDDGSGRVAFIMAPSLGILDIGFSLDLRLVASGSAVVSISSVDYTVT